MLKLAIILFGIVGTTLAGIAIVALLAIPALVDGKPLLIVAATVAGFIVAIPVSLLIANAILKANRGTV